MTGLKFLAEKEETGDGESFSWGEFWAKQVNQKSYLELWISFIMKLVVCLFSSHQENHGWMYSWRWLLLFDRPYLQIEKKALHLFRIPSLEPQLSFNLDNPNNLDSKIPYKMVTGPSRMSGTTAPVSVMVTWMSDLRAPSQRKLALTFCNLQEALCEMFIQSSRACVSTKQ